MTKIEEIREQSHEQLGYRLEEIDREIFKLINELKANHKLEKPHLLKSFRKEKARILTIQTQRKKGNK